MVVFVPALDVMKASGGDVALFAVEIVRTVVVAGKGKIEIDGTLVLTSPPPATDDTDRTSLLAAVVRVVVTLSSSLPTPPLADVVALSCPTGCCIRTKFVFSVMFLFSNPVSVSWDSSVCVLQLPVSGEFDRIFCRFLPNFELPEDDGDDVDDVDVDADAEGDGTAAGAGDVDEDDDDDGDEYSTSVVDSTFAVSEH